MKHKKFKLFSGIILASAAASLIHSGGEFGGVSLFNPLVNYAESSGASVGDDETTVKNFEVTGDVKFYRTDYFVEDSFRDLTDQSYEISVNQTVREGDKIVIKTKGLRLGLLDTYNIYANDSEKVVAKLKLKSVKDNIPNNGILSEEAINSTSGKAEKEAVYELVFTKEAENYKNLRIQLKYNDVPTFANPFVSKKRNEENKINFDYVVSFSNKTVINKSRKLIGYDGHDGKNGNYFSTFGDTSIGTTPYDFKFSGEILETLSKRHGNLVGDYQPITDVKTVDTGIRIGFNVIIDGARDEEKIQGIKAGDEIELNYSSEDFGFDLNNKFSVNDIITLKENFSNNTNIKNFTSSDPKLLLKSDLLFKVKILEKEKTDDSHFKLKVKIQEVPDGLVGKTFDLGELVSFDIKNSYSGIKLPKLEFSYKLIRDGNIVKSHSDSNTLLFSKAKLLEASGDKFKTVYQDEDGNQLKEEIGIKTDLSEIDGYKFIRKEVNNSGDLVATFHKKKTRFVYHENSSAAAIDIKALDGIHEKEEIDGYVYSRSEVLSENGDTIHHYFKKLPNKITNKAIPSPTIYEKDETREKGQPNLTTNGEPGSETITTTYSVNPQTGVVTPTVGNPVRTKEPTPTKVKVAAKDKVVERELPNRTRYIKDSEKEFGTPNETQTEGHPGREVTRTVYTVNPTNGTITEKTTTTRESEPQDKIIKVGTKRSVRNFKDTEGRNVTETTDYNVDDNGVVIPTTTTRTYGNQKDSTEVHKGIPSPIVYEKDESREKGQPNITVNGEPGDEVTTTTYSVDPQTGKITPTVGKPVRVKEPTPTKVKVAAKDKVVERELPNRTRYIKDSGKEFGTPNETQTEGHPGREVTRTVYTVNSTYGTITEKTTTTRESEPQDKVIKVGSKRSVRDFKDTEGRNVTETTDYNVDETTGVVSPTVTRSYGNQKDSTEVHKSIPSPVVYEKDETRNYGEPNQTVNGEPGDEVTTTTYSVDPQTGTITPTVGKPVRVKEPTPTKVKVAAKDKVVENELPNKIHYVKDSEKEFGTPNETQTEGKPGLEVIRTVYTVNPTDGSITEKTTATRESEPQDGTIKVGAKNKVETYKDEEGRTVNKITEYNVDETTGAVTPSTTITYGDKKDSTEFHKSIPSPVVYEKDDTRDYGQPNQTVNGEPGDEVTTTTYSVDPKTGKITSTVGNPVIKKEPTSTKVKVAAKDKVVENDIPYKTTYVEDETADFGTPNKTQDGVPGKERITTTYSVDPKTGEVTSKEEKIKVSDPKNKTVKVGTKPKIEQITENGNLYEVKTIYKLNKETGEITPETTKRFIKKVQGETKEPTVKAALNTGVDASSNIFPILSLIGMTGGIVLPIRLKKKD